MEEGLSVLRKQGDQIFLRLTKTALTLVQNILNDPGQTKYRRLRAASQYVSKPGVPELLSGLGFHLKGEEYVLPYSVETLITKKKQLIEARKATGSLIGWDIPSSSIKFSNVLGKGQFGDTFLGQMEGDKVVVKVLRPDCGQEAKTAFDRELDILSKVSHPNILPMLAVTLTSEPTSLVMEHISECLLDVLHKQELCETTIMDYAYQTASAMVYLHQHNVLHCDLAARNLYLGENGELKLSEFGHSRWDGPSNCRLYDNTRPLLKVRWTAPEVIESLHFTKHSEVWSYGVFLYELVTGGSVPYATFNNNDVRLKVLEGYRLPHPQGCPEELYKVMLRCWAQRPTDRPHFTEVLQGCIQPLQAKAASGDLKPAVAAEEATGTETKASHKSSGKKSKVKELSYQSVVVKGGGLLRVYSALVSPLEHRVVVVCGKKTTVAEVVATALAKCGKQDLDPKSYRLVLVSGVSSGTPAHYLGSEERVLSLKAEAPPTGIFLLCVNTPGDGLLELIDSVRQNPAYGTAFSPVTRGYLVHKEKGAGHRNWCVMDGSTLLCYKQEEDEGVKQLESYHDFKSCTVSPTGSKKRHLFTVETADGTLLSFQATDKDSTLQWIEAIDAATTFDPSPILLQTRDGAVTQASFVKCQEFAKESTGKGLLSPIQPVVQHKLSTSNGHTSACAAVDYGKQWTVLRSTGLIQCLVNGRAETLFNLADISSVKVHNPREMREGVDYFIEVESTESRFVLKAETPTDHFDWILVLETYLRGQKREKILHDHRKRESGYVAFKRLLLLQSNKGSSSQLYCMPRAFDDMEDIYDPPSVRNIAPPREPKRSELLQPKPILEEHKNAVPLPPRDYNPPPVPPRDASGPPLPPRARSSSAITIHSRPTSVSSFVGAPEDDYVLMQSPKGGHPPTCRLGSSLGRSPSMPITIPNPRPSKRSVLLRANSESSTHSQTSSPGTPLGTSLSNLHEGYELGSSFTSGRTHQSSSSSIHSLTRQSSTSSVQSLNRQNSSHSLSSYNHSHFPPPTPPPRTPPRTMEERSSGYGSPLLDMSPSPNRAQRYQNGSQRTLVGYCSSESPRGYLSDSSHQSHASETSRSDGMVVSEAKQIGRMIESGRSSLESTGYGSNGSSTEDLPQLPLGWERGYCENKCRYFYFNALTGDSKWNLGEVLVLDKVGEPVPGVGWEMARTEDGRVYYYHGSSRRTTWSIEETWA